MHRPRTDAHDQPRRRRKQPVDPPSEVDSLIRKLVRLEFNGYDGHIHAFACADWTVAVCVALGIKGKRLMDARLGALLHDIGKVYVGEDILSSPYELTAREREHIQHHSAWGAQIVRDCARGDAWMIPQYHHERWDGTGYPEGLKGKEIPLIARAFSPIDVYDALVMRRPYRSPSAYTPQQAWEIVRRGAGTQFDPDAVVAFGKVSGLSKRGRRQRVG